MIDWSTAEMWLIRATMPIVPATAVSASSSGMLAATSAPNVISRMISVIGSEVISARWKSLLMTSEICFSALASPNCSMLKSRCAAWAARVAASVASTRSLATLSLPTSSKRSSAECPLAEIRAASPRTYGLSKARVYGVAARRRCTSSTTAWNDGSLARSDGLWMITSSVTCLGKALWIATEARPDSPTPLCAFSCVTMPAELPIANTSTTAPSHPQIASLRCPALQRPARAARFLLWPTSRLAISVQPLC